MKASIATWLVVVASACGGKPVVAPKPVAAITSVCPAVILDDQPWAKELFPGCPGAPFAGKVDVCDGKACPRPCRVVEGDHIYEAKYSLTGLWEETRMVDGVGKDDLVQLTCRRDDKSGLLAACTRRYVGSLEFTDRIARDAKNQITQVQNDQEHIDVGRDRQGRVSSLEMTHGRVTFEYDEAGRLVKELRDGIATTYDYDARGRLSDKTDSNHHTTYGYAGDTTRVTEITEHDHVGRGQAQKLVYDAEGRLARIHRYDGASTSYQYDCR